MLLRDFLFHFAKRYIAGTKGSEAVEAAKSLNGQNISAAIDILGESVLDASQAGAAVKEYLDLLHLIKAEGVDSSVSLKLTHLGLDISDGLAEANTETVVKKALELGNFVRIDMEGSAYTQRTLEIFLKLRKRYPNVGVAIQSCLLRSAEDIRLMIEKGASVRIVKGAYKEPRTVAFRRKADVDRNFSILMKELLIKGNRPAIATHDERLINEAIEFSASMNIPKEGFEFEMLLGIKRTLQKRLAEDGYKVRVYVPYGENWLPYTLRRLRERRENVYFVIKNIFD